MFLNEKFEHEKFEDKCSKKTGNSGTLSILSSNWTKNATTVLPGLNLKNLTNIIEFIWKPKSNLIINNHGFEVFELGVTEQNVRTSQT